MKILFFFPGLNRYRYFKPLINLAKYLSENGNEVFIATAENPNKCQVENFSGSVKFVVKEDGISKINWVVKLLRSDFDVYIGVQAHNGYWLSLAKLFCLRFSKKIVSWEHSSPITSLKNEYKYNWLLWLIFRWILSKFTDSFFCVSNGAVNEMRNSFAFSSKKILYTPNLIYRDKDIKDFINYSDHDDDVIRFLSVGRLAKEKGLHLAIEALSKLNFLNFKYLIVGDGPCKNDLNKLCKSLPGMENKTEFLGLREDINYLMRSSHVLLLPSYFEGLPTVLVEACVNRLPIIAANCRTGPSEIVIDGKNGYLFEVGDTEELKSAIVKWVNNKKSIKNNLRFAADYGDAAGFIFTSNLDVVISNV